jgi:hypothetical protein
MTRSLTPALRAFGLLLIAGMVWLATVVTGTQSWGGMVADRRPVGSAAPEVMLIGFIQILAFSALVGVFVLVSRLVAHPRIWHTRRA